jgi:hypothetical protein
LVLEVSTDFDLGSEVVSFEGVALGVSVHLFEEDDEFLEFLCAYEVAQVACLSVEGTSARG